MTTLTSTDHALPLVLQRDGACLREVVARRHGRRRNPARRSPRSSLRTPINRLRHSPQRWVEKAGRSIKGSKHRTPISATKRSRGFLAGPRERFVAQALASRRSPGA